MSAAQKALDEYEAKPIQELIHNAQQLLHLMCKDGPKRHWVMSVPVRPDDSDIVIGTALRNAGERIAALERQNALFCGLVDAWTFSDTPPSESDLRRMADAYAKIIEGGASVFNR
jgi:predicted short-subunit dehydrogenase-like oxidoreductase (DUF2520 family)